MSKKRRKLTFLCTPMVYATDVCCFIFINKLHNWWYTKKPKLIAVAYKTHGVKRINTDLRGNTTADRKQLTDYKTYSPTWKPDKYSFPIIFVYLFMVVLMCILGTLTLNSHLCNTILIAFCWGWVKLCSATTQYIAQV